MAWRIECMCGKTVTGENQDELWANAQAHVARTTPSWWAR
jgi:hypothetical protein